MLFAQDLVYTSIRKLQLSFTNLKVDFKIVLTESYASIAISEVKKDKTDLIFVFNSDPK